MPTTILWTITLIAFAAALVGAVPATQDEQGAAPPRDVVMRRGNHEPITGEVTNIDAAGVTVRSAAGSSTIPLHLVRDVDSDRHEEDWQRYQPMAEQLWRTVIRIRRSDFTLAEPLLDRLFSQYRGQTNETALVVAEGLLRSRLSRAANEQAVLPWLEVARLRRAGVTSDAFSNQPAVIDEASLLCPQLPPVWPVGTRTQRLRDDLAAFDARDDAVVASLALHYRHFAELALGGNVEIEVTKGPQQPDIEILAGLASVRTSAAADSVNRAERLASNWPEWAQAWMRYHFGLSLMQNEDRRSHDLGLVQLAHLPANHRYTQPYLAGVALEVMAASLESRGEKDHAGALRRLVDERYPGHPALIASPPTRTLELKANP